MAERSCECCGQLIEGAPFSTRRGWEEDRWGKPRGPLVCATCWGRWLKWPLNRREASAHRRHLAFRDFCALSPSDAAFLRGGLAHG